MTIIPLIKASQNKCCKSFFQIKFVINFNIKAEKKITDDVSTQWSWKNVTVNIVNITNVTVALSIMTKKFNCFIGFSIPHFNTAY